MTEDSRDKKPSPVRLLTDPEAKLVVPELVTESFSQGGGRTRRSRRAGCPYRSLRRTDVVEDRQGGL